MVKIFAKHGTTEKAIVVCRQEDQVRNIQLKLSERYGGNWLWVDKIHPGEYLLFSDKVKYLGFDDKEERYCEGLNKL